MVNGLILITTSHLLLDTVHILLYMAWSKWNSGVTLFAGVTNGHTHVTCLVVHKSHNTIALGSGQPLCIMSKSTVPCKVSSRVKMKPGALQVGMPYHM
jgi:hypothetical protein